MQPKGHRAFSGYCTTVFLYRQRTEPRRATKWESGQDEEISVHGFSAAFAKQSAVIRGNGPLSLHKMHLTINVAIAPGSFVARRLDFRHSL